MKDIVLEFIDRRFKNDCSWCTGNCYWFAVILSVRFPSLNIYLFQIENHFMAGDGKVFYDWRGKRSIEDCEEVPIIFEDLKNIDSSYYNRIRKYCIL